MQYEYLVNFILVFKDKPSFFRDVARKVDVYFFTLGFTLNQARGGKSTPTQPRLL